MSHQASNPPLTLTVPLHAPSGSDQFRSLESTIEYCIGDFGWKQFLQSAILSFAWFFDAQQSFITIFADAQPKWSCNNSPSSPCNTTNICQLPKDSWSWDLPTYTTIISEWSLECSGPIITGLPASSFFFGCLVGTLALATLADSSLGRKKMLIICCLLMSLSGLLAVVSTNIWMYAGFRFVSGFGRSPILTVALVHATELVGERWREKIGTMGFFFYTLGFLSLPIIAFMLKGSSWRFIYLYTCCPCAVHCLTVYFFVRESPRWLFVNGRKCEFVETLRSMAEPQKRSILTDTILLNCVEWTADGDDKSEPQHIYSALKTLVKKGWAFRRLAILMVVSSSAGLVYYGLPLGLGNLPFNLYLSVTLNALSELPASLLTFFIVKKVKRKSSLIGLTLLSGICGVSTVFARWKGLQMALVLLSFSTNITAFNVMLLYALELFPTCVRNSGVSMVRQAALVGGIIGPIVAAISRKSGMVSYVVFGVTIAICGVLVAWLPETKGRVLCDTMEEEEQMMYGFEYGA